jgi:hypothetical protein
MIEQEEYLGEQTPYSVMPPQNLEEKEAPEIGIIRELSPRKVLEQLEMNLRGFFWDYEQKRYIKKENFEPLMNEKAIAKFVSVVSSFVSDIVTFSAYSIEEINKRVQFVCETLLPVLYINHQEYGIQKSDLFLIDIKVFVMCDAAFRKAMGGGDRGVIRGTLSENIMSRTGTLMREEKQGGFLHRLNPFAR